MLWGKRKPGPSAPRRQKRAFRPATNRLEPRMLLAIDLSNTAGTPAGTPPGPFGVIEAGGQNSGGVGFSVAEVGDVNGDGFDDFVLGAPTITSAGSVPVLGNGNGARAYLVFGSARPDGGNTDWLQLTSNDRTGDLNNLGSPNQNNPVTGSPQVGFNGITFISSQQASSTLGASVVGVGNIDGNSAGISSFMIGAPGADGSNGRAYLIYGSTALTNQLNKTVDLDNLAASPGVNVMTFTNTAAGARTGRSVAVAGPFLDDGFTDIAIGAPNATITGSAGQGAVYVVAGNFLRPARTVTVPINTVGQAGGISGVIFSGANSGDAAGRSVAGVGNVDGATGAGGRVISDLAIGAPQVGDTGTANGAGKAYLIYGGSVLLTQGTTVGGVTSINLSRVGASDVQGAVFLGDSTGDNTGFAVGTGGDFNSDGLGDFLIGSPLWNSGQGRATLIEGVAASSSTGHIAGTFDIGDLPSTVPFVEFDGQSGDAAAGFSVSSTGAIISSVPEQLLIGTPGFNGGQGAAFLVPANSGLFGVQTLSESTPVFGTEMTLSTPTGKNFLGSGVSGNLFINAAGRTADTDARSDFVVGAAGFPLLAARVNAGGGFMLEGAFIPIQTPVISQLTSQIGVDAPFGAPFRISATTPTTLLIYVFSSTTSGNPNFVPLRDLDPSTVKVNGVAFPGATIAADPVDENGDGLQDAIITISPRSAIGLTAATTTFTLTSRTLSTSPNANQSYSSSTSIIVSGGGSGGGGIPSSRNAALGLNNPNAAVPQFGERFLPQPTTLGRLRWKPLPARVAYNQFLPVHTFATRNEQFLHPRIVHPSGSRFEHAPRGISTLSRSVFRRGRFPTGVYGGPIFHQVKNTVPPSLHR